MTTVEHTDARWRAAALAVAPAVMMAAFLAHPFIAVIPRDTDVIAAAATEAPTRWAAAHLLTAVGSGLLLLAFLALRHELREAGDERSSSWGIVFVALGSTMYAFLPGMEFAPFAAGATGADAEAAQQALTPWFVPVLATSACAFAIGVLGFCRGLAGTPLLGRPLTRLVVGALAVMALARFVPLGAVQFHVQGVAGVVALWPLAHHLWHRGSVREIRSPQASPAT